MMASFLRVVKEMGKSEGSLARLWRMQCKVCPYQEQLEGDDRMRLQPEGSRKPTIYILGNGLVGGDQLGEIKEALGRKECSDLRVSNLASHEAPYGRYLAKDMNKAIECCRRTIESDIAGTKPKVLLLVGKDALEWAYPGQNIDGWYGRKLVFEINGHRCWALAIQTEGMQKDGGFYQQKCISEVKELAKSKKMPLKLNSDLCTAKVFRGNGEKHIKPYLQYLLTRDWVALSLRTVNNEDNRHSFRVDSEQGKGARCTSVAFYDSSNGKSFGFNLRGTEERRTLIEFIKEYEGQIVVHDVAMIWGWLVRMGEGRLSYDLLFNCRWEDIQAASYILDSRGGDKGMASLGNMLKGRLGIDAEMAVLIDKTVKDGDEIDKEMKSNGLRAKWIGILYRELKDEIVEEGLEPIYEDQVKRAVNFKILGSKGVMIDQGRRSQLLMQYQEASKIEKEIIDRSKDMTLTFLGFVEYKERKERCRKIDRVIRVNLEGFGEKEGRYVWPDGLVHSRYNTGKTSTRRTSCAEPNLQNIPRNGAVEGLGDLRSMVVPRKGKIFVVFDYEQMEVRLIAAKSGSKKMIAQLQEGQDVHSYWAQYLREEYPKKFGDKGVKELRQIAKSLLVFPLFYGGDHRGLVRRLGLTTSQALTVQDYFWSVYSEVKEWQGTLKENYQRLGYVELEDNGFRRYGPLSDNEILNTPIQGFASEIVVRKISRLIEMGISDEGCEAHIPVMTRHDDMVFEVRKDRYRELISSVAPMLVSGSEDIKNKIKVDLKVDIEVGFDLAKLKKIGTCSSEGKKVNWLVKGKRTEARHLDLVETF